MLPRCPETTAGGGAGAGGRREVDGPPRASVPGGPPPAWKSLRLEACRQRWPSFQASWPLHADLTTTPTIPSPLPLQFLKWVAPSAGFLNAYACSDAFEASLTIIGDGNDADGKPIKVRATGGRRAAGQGLRDPLEWRSDIKGAGQIS